MQGIDRGDPIEPATATSVVSSGRSGAPIRHGDNGRMTADRRRADATSRSTSDGLGLAVVVILALVLSGYQWVLSVGIKEECSSTLGSAVWTGSKRLYPCVPLAWFFGASLVATLAVVVFAAVDARRPTNHRKIRRLGTYLVLLAAAAAVNLLPLHSMGYWPR